MNASEQDRENRLLALAGEMAAQLRGGRADGIPQSLDASFERDYGFDSLSRMELMHRVERAFGVTLSERALGEAESPRDLLREIADASGKLPPAQAQRVPERVDTGARSAARNAVTLTEALAWHARRHPDQLHVRFYADDSDGETLSYGELWNDAGRVAAGLIERNVAPGEAVVIMLPSGRDYFASFFGVLRAGGVPVPVYPPGRPREIEDHVRRHAKIAANAQARVMITVQEAVQFSRVLAAQVDNIAGIVTVAQLMEASLPNVWPEPRAHDGLLTWRKQIDRRS